MGSQPVPTGLGLLPWPRALDLGSGVLRLTSPRFELVADGISSARLERAVARLAASAAALTGLPLDSGEPLPIRLRCAAESAAAPGIREDEGYWLVVDDAGLYLDAGSEWGALRGLETLAQLISPEGVIPHLAVDDRPRFPWRGLLLDPARRFIPAADLERTLDAMARCKLNVLHLHLSDDQGFRLPVPTLPKLASAEAYTREELAALVARAADLGIRIVPEIDMPGHVTSWLTAYPELGARQVGATDRFGVHAACLDPGSEAVYAAIGKILDAVVEVFPDPCLHIGGDEVSPRWWSEDPSVQALMAAEGLSDLRAVQGYFNRRVGELVAARGRQAVAWDEALDSDPDEGWVIQAWRGCTTRDRALAAGHRVVLSAPYYMDLHYPVDVHYGFDPAAPQEVLVALEDALTADPRFAHVAAGMRWTEHWREGALTTPPASGDLLGGEACLWGELVNPSVLDVRLWTRLPAVAERLWSPVALTDVDALHERLDRFLDRTLPLAGIDLAAQTSRALDRLDVPGRWRELVAMLEPVKWYGRLLGAEALAARLEGREMPQARPYDACSPLDALVDHLPVESRRAREVMALCLRVAGGDDRARDLLEQILDDWLALAADADEAPVDLQELAHRLGGLAAVIRDRLDGVLAAEETLGTLTTPADELMLGLPSALRQWLIAS